ncbi:TPA: hypothetical protein HA259_07490 [Thermoplasmata archaeon]|nr:hypothetical protein [Thermoplasmata archaeon]
MKWDFRTWLVQNYGVQPESLDEEGLEIAKKEYAEEYPEPGEVEVKLKTYPFKRYLEARGTNLD